MQIWCLLTIGPNANRVQAQGALHRDAAGEPHPDAAPAGADGGRLRVPLVQNADSLGDALHHRSLHQLHNPRGGPVPAPAEALDRAGSGVIHLAEMRIVPQMGSRKIRKGILAVELRKLAKE